ncbi:MAG: DNA adenine methylase [Candidatus Coproplasma sp.]
MNSILKYPGGKWRIADWIISFFPKHKVYVEPYFGSGALFFRKEPSYIETINDINGDIVNLFKVCREQPEELAAALTFTPYSRNEYVSCYDTSVGNEVERARRLIVRHHQSFGTTNSNLNTWRNSQSANSPRTAAEWKRLPNIVLEISERLKDAQIECLDALKLIERYNSPDTLLYLDPPYMQGLRKRGMYKYEMTDSQHEELISLILSSKSKIILSAYDNDLYNRSLKGWFTSEKHTTAQMGKHRIEKIYMNFSPSLWHGDEEQIK